MSITDWGADSTVLLNLYRSLIRSKLDYGCIVYGSACPSYIKLLDQSIINDYDSHLERSERLQLSLYVEANEPSLENKRIKFGMQYATKLKAYLQILHTTLFSILYLKMFTINNPIQFNLLDSE